MSKVIDERVVEMRFDNQQFENNVKTSMGTLEKLKQSLKLTDASKGLENINSSVKTFNMSPMSNAVETVRAKFSALEVMAVTALANITNSAVNAGKRLVSAFTIEPIKTGMQEYETQINAVQTILANTANKGTNLKQVNDALDELNYYADKTIYNFTEMTRNIGTFTAAGIDLDTSVNAIQGIANLAAVSGSTSQQASTAMYQLSQALATGTVRLMDWNSVVNAGMGGQIFQEALKQTSEELQTGAEAAIKAKGSFRESLQAGWLTSQVLTETLKKFTTSGANEYVAKYCNISKDAVSAALEAAEAQYGEADAIDKASEALAKKTGKNKDEIKSILEFAKNAEDAATKVKTFSQLLDTLKEAAQSGWTQTWEILIGDFEEAKSLWTSASDYFGSAINNMSNARNELLQDWANAGGRTMAIEAIKNAFSGLLSVINPIKDAFKEIFPAITSDQLVNITEKIRDLTSKLKLSESQANNLKNAFSGIFSVVKVGINVVTTLIGVAVKIASSFSFLVSGILSVAGAIGNFANKITEVVNKTHVFSSILNGLVNLISAGIKNVENFFNILSSGIDTSTLEAFKNVLTAVFNFITNTASKIKDVLSNMFDFENITAGLNALNAGLVTAILLNVKKFATGFTTTLLEKFSTVPKFIDKATNVLDSVRSSLEKYQQYIQAGTLRNIAIAVGILAASILVLSTINPEKLSSALAAITILFGELTLFMLAFSNLEFVTKGLIKLSGAMLVISTSVLILAGAVKSMSGLNWSDLAKGLVGTITLLGSVVGASIILSSFGGKIKKGALQIVILASAIKILASACNDLSKLSWNKLTKGLVGVGVLLTSISLFINKSTFTLKALPVSIAILTISAALKVLSSACKDFGKLSWKEIGKGLASVAALLAELSIFVTLTGSSKSVISTAVSLVIIASAIKILSSSIITLSGLKWKEIGKGLTAMGGALLEIGIAMNLLPKNMILIGSGLVIAATAITILTEAFTKFGSMSWSEIGRGLSSFGGSIVILAMGLKAMTGTFAGSAALFVAATAIAILAPALNKLGSMSLKEIGKSLLALAGGFTVIGLAATLLTPIIPALIGLSAALALFGTACLAVGAGITLLGIGLTSLAAIVPAHIASIVGSFVLLAQGLGDIIVAVCDSIKNSATAIGGAIKTLILTLVDVIISCAPDLAKAALVLLDEVLSALIEHGPEIADSFLTIFTGAIAYLSTNAKKITDALADFIISIINGLSSRTEDILSALATFIESIFKGLLVVAGPLIENIIGPLVEIVTNAFLRLLNSLSFIISNITVLVQQLGVSFSQIFTSVASIVSTCGNTIYTVLLGIGNSINTVLTSISNVITSIGGAINTVLGGISGLFDSIGKSALNAGEGFKRLAIGVKTMTELKLADVASTLGAVAIGLGKIAGKSKELKAVSDGIKSIGSNIQTASKSFESINHSADSAVKSINSIGVAMTTVASSIEASSSTISSAMSNVLTSINHSISNSATTIKTSFINVFDKALSAIKSMGSKFVSAGKELINKMATGISSSKSRVSSVIIRIMSSVVTTIRGCYSSFSSAGKHLGDGLVVGINSKKTSAYNAGYALGQAAVRGERAGQQSNSPSKLTKKAGEWFGEGLVLGIKQMGDKVYKAGYSLGEDAVVALSDSISNIDSIFNDDIESNPTIKPILDLDDVQNGVGLLNDMLNFSSSIGVLNDANTISSYMNRKQIETTNDDVVFAINKLNDRLNRVGDIYNINGITYDDGTNISDAVRTLVRAAKIERRV